VSRTYVVVDNQARRKKYSSEASLNPGRKYCVPSNIGESMLSEEQKLGRTKTLTCTCTVVLWELTSEFTSQKQRQKDTWPKKSAQSHVIPQSESTMNIWTKKNDYCLPRALFCKFSTEPHAKSMKGSLQMGHWNAINPQDPKWIPIRSPVCLQSWSQKWKWSHKAIFPCQAQLDPEAIECTFLPTSLRRTKVNCLQFHCTRIYHQRCRLYCLWEGRSVSKNFI
jgi:hypothetical protein